MTTLVEKNSIDFEWAKDLTACLSKFLEDCIEGYKKVDTISGGVLNLLFKSWMHTMGFISSSLISSYNKTEKEAIQNTKRLNVEISEKIIKIRSEVNSMNEKKEEFERKVLRLRKEKYFLSKLIYQMKERELSYKDSINTLVVDKTKLVNENANLKL
jgi:hypothetical protein